MCFHYSLTNKAKRKDARYYFFEEDYHLLRDFEYYHINAFLHPEVPVVSSNNSSKIHNFQWGLIPKWVKSEEQAIKMMKSTLNARSETIFEKPSFRANIKNKCLVLADGFYEWHTLANRKKQPYFIHLKDRELFAFAGLYNQWLNAETGELRNTFTILTKKANKIMTKIHNKPKYAEDHRMPVILYEKEFNDWLNADNNDMKTFFETKEIAFEYYPVNQGLQKNAKMNNEGVQCRKK